MRRNSHKPKGVMIAGFHWYLVVAADEVDLGKYGRAGQVAIEVLDVREGVAVVHGSVIEAAEITTQSPAPPGFPNHV